MVKLNKCFETNPNAWRAVNGYGLQLLSLCNLAHYRLKLPNKENLQDKWKAAVTHPGKYVNLLVGQLDDKDIRAERDEENFYNDEPWNRVMMNYHLAYHQVKAHLHWLASRPDEAEHYHRFQVSVFSICVATLNCNCY